MNKKEKEALSYFTQAYDRLKTVNEPYRTKFDTYDEFYRGYRDKTRYPMTYNYSFNKIIPIIYTILSRVMSHLYRTSDIVVVKARKKKDIQRSTIIEGVMNYQLANLNDIDTAGGSYMLMLKWMLSALIYGKGVVKAFWRKEERISPRRIVLNIPQIGQDQMGRPFVQDMQTKDYIIEESQVVYDGPYVENIPIRNFLPDPEYRDIQKMPCVAHLYTKSIDWLKAQQRNGTFHNVRELGEVKGSFGKASGNNTDSEEFKSIFQSIENAYTMDEIETEHHKANNIDIIDCYGKYALEKPIYEVGSGISMKGQEDEVLCTIANYDTVVRLEKTKYGIKPFFDIGAHINADRYWDTGIIELVKDQLEAYNNISNLRMQNAMMKVNTMIKVLVDSDIDPRALVWKPFGIIPVDAMDEVEMFDTPDVNSQVFREQIEFIDRCLQDVTGIYDYSKGVTPQRAEGVGVMYSLQSVGEARIKLLMMTMDYMGMRPLLKYIILLNCYNLPTGFEYRIVGLDSGQQQQFGQVFGTDLHLDYDFEAKYAAMEPALAKEFRLNQLMQLSTQWQQDPTVNQYEFKKAIFELLDWAQPERFLTDPDVVARQQQQAQQMQMMPQLLELQNKKEINLEDNKTKLIAQTMESEDVMKTEKMKADAQAKTRSTRNRKEGRSSKGA